MKYLAALGEILLNMNLCLIWRLDENNLLYFRGPIINNSVSAVVQRCQMEHEIDIFMEDILAEIDGSGILPLLAEVEALSKSHDWSSG